MGHDRFVRNSNLVPAILVGRINRFLALVDLAGSPQNAFVANSGRLAELMLPGARVFLAPVSRPEGRTQFDLKLVDHCGVLVCVDTRAPNDLLHRALVAGSLPEFQEYDSVRREVTYDTCRFDFALDGPKGPCFVEAKSVTLVQNGRALFPDAPTERGTKHVATLRRALDNGYRAAVVFIIQRGDAHTFSPHDEMDPAFGQALREAVASGVEAYAYRCIVDLKGTRLEGRVQIVL